MVGHRLFGLGLVCLLAACSEGSDFGDDGAGGSGGGSESSSSSPSINVSGTWDTVWGSTSSPMTLTQSGSSVSGTYDLADSYGSISGTLSGRTLQGSWSDKYGSGDLTFTFSADGNSFTGTWGDGATWNGHRTGGSSTTTGSPGGCQDYGATCSTTSECCGVGICVDTGSADGIRCAGPCTTASQCDSGCCANLESGGGACVPASFCGG